jgi:hypothetical protein
MNPPDSSPPHRFARLVWAIPLLTSTMVGAAVWMRDLNVRLKNLTTEIVAGELILGIVYPVVGGLILQRRPRHGIGLILCGMGFAAALALFGTQYNLYSARAELQPLANLLGWIGNFTFYIYLASGALLILLFPNGRPLTPRWRWVSGAILLSIVYYFLAVFITFPPSTVSTQAYLSGEFSPQQTALLERYLLPLIFAFLPVGYLLAISALVLRYRRASSIERQQLKWLVFGGSLGIGIIMLSVLLNYFPPLKALSVVFNEVGLYVFVIAIPVAVTVAILRHRLYSIDLIIRRTLVYGLLTAVLALVYFAGVFVFQRGFGLLAGQVGKSPLAIVLSTLAIAALFTPLRKRIQNFIDRRFYRRRYDSEQTLQAFAAALRDEVDLDRLSEHLVAVVQETMQPESATLWLRGTKKPSAHRDPKHRRDG